MLDFHFRTLLTRRTVKLGLAAAMVATAAFAMAPRASATVISFYNDASAQTGLRYTLGCGSATGDCFGKLEALIATGGTYDSTNPLIGQTFALGDSGIGTETAFVNANAAGGASFATGTQIQGSGGSYQFTTNAEYFLIKTGQGRVGGPPYGMLYNISGGSLDLYFTAIARGTGFSHYTVFGTATPPVSVPEPAVLATFGGGLLLVGLFLGLRRKYA